MACSAAHPEPNAMIAKAKAMEAANGDGDRGEIVV
jgi:hypothetical protein